MFPLTVVAPREFLRTLILGISQEYASSREQASVQDPTPSFKVILGMRFRIFGQVQCDERLHARVLGKTFSVPLTLRKMT
jgi:hypothetical protein